MYKDRAGAYGVIFNEGAYFAVINIPRGYFCALDGAIWVFIFKTSGMGCRRGLRGKCK